MKIRTFLLLSTFLTFAGAHPALAERRCGWFENPTPANAWLTDKDGQWIISSQGAEGSEDIGDWPSFADDQWVMTNAGSYGYGCACMDVETKVATHRVLKIKSTTSLPLTKCRADKNLTEPENPLDDAGQSPEN